jgi:cytochrome c553
MLLTWRRLLLLLIVGLLGALLFAWSGLFNVGASTGHWAITDWFLHYTMRRSVETRASGIAVPALDHPALIHRGAGHYASGCAPCHGAPGLPRSPVAQAMTPPPPLLTESVPEWRPNELFWIVRHGVKFTGMPAWPALPRTDEVWAMVAFLLQLPEMQPDEYRMLAAGEVAQEHYQAGLVGLADPFEPVLAECARCHGRDGSGRGVGAFPILTGQSEAYLLASLQAYAHGHRHSGIMQPAAAPLDDQQMRRLAAHFAGAGPFADAPEPDGPGASIARGGVPADGIPACNSCHEPPGERYPAYPALRGQTADYIAQQLRLFKAGIRGGTPYAHIMETVARRMNEAQIDAVAAYFGTSPER